MTTPSPNPAPGAFERVAAQARARGLPGITEAEADGHRALAVAGEFFARLDEAGILALDCPPQQKALLIEISPNLYFDPPGREDEPLLFIRLERIGDEELSLRLHDAWHFRAPASLKAEHRRSQPKR